ncbi:hypothetical protein IDJ75_06650 [Mucilaginibacter rigui]|uniref:Uncharacterized protein n=1 Tax=Mucilaginibacter rigui TaxID=534635 RepID=A0ABR7X2Z4_9SPHI|nr:hypothetical protein [Mucilaginibacter rigui]MBD1384951.1 hypothetical protein [Mucilaginibacter rigui]
MTRYLLVSFYTLTGIRKVIDLGDFSYGEWVIYEDKSPVYLVNLHTENEPDMIINSLLNKGIETIESIVSKINIKQGTNLSLANMPVIRLIKSEEQVELDLPPLPIDWLKNI